MSELGEALATRRAEVDPLRTEKLISASVPSPIAKEDGVRSIICPDDEAVV